MISSRVPFPGFIKDNFSNATPNVNLDLGRNTKLRLAEILVSFCQCPLIV